MSMAGDSLSDLAIACRVLAANGHDDFIWGHVAVRDAGDRGVWMKRSGLGLEEIEVSDLLLVDANGDVIEGEGPRHVEWPIHTEIMAARRDVNAVVHTHPPHSIALGAAATEMLPISHAGAFFVPPTIPRFTKTSELITSRELGHEVAAALGDARALHLVNHGIVTVGADLAEAVCGAVLFEKAAEQQLLTAAFGGAVRWSTDDEALAKRATIWSAGQREALWAYLKRRSTASHRQGELRQRGSER